MTLLHRLASMLAWVFRRDRVEAELDAEMRDFVERSAAEKMAGGAAPEDARRLARLELGGVEPVKEQVRASRHGHLLDEIWRDVSYAFRMYARTPGFTVVVLVTLALGIGANTAIFSLLDALMLRSLPVKRANELVLVNLRERTHLDAGGETLSYAIARGIDGTNIFAGLGGFTAMTFDAGAAGAVRRVPGAIVTGGFYRTLGLEPAAGRLLTRDDDQPGADVVAVISDAFWQQSYDRSVTAIGQTLLLNGVAARIVGVSPREFSGATVGAQADITIAAAAVPTVQPSLAAMLNPGNFFLRIIARPQPGLSVAETTSRLNAAWAGMAESVIAPYWPADRRQAMAQSIVVLEPGATGWTYLREIYVRPLVVLFALAGAVLLIICANVASLFLARATARERELALRLAIGAGRRRIVRQLLIEAAVISVAGAAIGVAVAYISSRFLIDLISTGPFRVAFDLTPDARVLAFSVVVGIGTGVLFGLAPAYRTRRIAPASAMADDVRTTSRRSKLLPSLVALQVALSLILVTGAGLFARSLRNLQQLDPGFRPEGAYVVSIARGKGPAPAELLDIIRRVPGVTAAGVGTHTPLDGSSWSEAIVPAGQPLPATDTTRVIGIGPDFLAALQVPFVAGRDIDDRDIAGARAVAIINERYAQRFFPGRNPIGEHLVTSLDDKQFADLEIVGLVRNSTVAGLRRQPPAIVYLRYAPLPNQTPSFVWRATTDAVEPVRSALQAQLPDQAIEVRPLAGQVNATIVQDRLMASLASGFGVLALVLSSIGIYGLLAYTVAQRRKEIGIRLALGATPLAVIGLVLAQSAWLLVAGLMLGYPAAWAASRSITSMLYGLRPTDPATMASAAGVLIAAAMLASYLPARRASHVDPLRALRHD